MTEAFSCARCGATDRPPLGAAPFPNEIGQRVAREICVECWEEWKRRQMLLINHYGLNVRDSRARVFLMANLRAFLFDQGEGEAPIDTSRQGQVDW